MKKRFPILLGLASSGVAAMVLTRVAGSTTVPSEKVPGKPRVNITETNLVVPHSVFSIPTSKAEGRDPFFPDCDCGAKPVIKQDPTTPNTPTLALALNGLSGAADHRLAIINGKTFAQGETQNIPASNGGRIAVKCVEIKENSVIVEVGGKQQELSLHSN